MKWTKAGLNPTGASTLRIARPTRSMSSALSYWADGVGLDVFGQQRDEHGSGNMLAFLGFPGALWHLELVDDEAIDPSPTPEDLLVLYLGGTPDEEYLRRIERNGGHRVPARNPYWDEHGVTYQDPDGYLLVLSTRSWQN